MHAAALDRAGPDEGDLDRQIPEAAGAEAGEGAHLGAGLDLEDPDGVRGAEHAVDGLVLQVQLPQLHRRVVVVGDQVDRVADRREHPQAEQVEFDQFPIESVC